MIVGSGLIASAMRREDVPLPSFCVYAAGVSNSSCKLSAEFERERQRLSLTLQDLPENCRLVYFGTCSVSDPSAADTPYVKHKLAMEELALKHGNSTIFRLPQVVGPTPNPHTLTNYLFARIARSERFTIWAHARRYLIDVNDMARIACDLLRSGDMRNQIANVACPTGYSVFQIVAAMEQLVGKSAHYDVQDKGAEFSIDTRLAEASAGRLGIDFGPGYLERTLARTYG